MDNMEEMRKYQEECNLRSQLESSVSEIGDWKLVKYLEYIAAGLTPPYDIAEAYAKRQAIRDQLSVPTEEEQAINALNALMANRASAVSKITVEVDGMTFDGDEKAQERMARAVVLADSMDETTEWVLADHTVAHVTAAQLKRACKLAGLAQTQLWTVPYAE